MIKQKKFVADLHIHSKYSRAVSKEMTILKIWEWARIKGIDIVATSDWTHPLWLREIKKELEEIGNGLLKLKNKNSKMENGKNPHFLLSTELSSIYSQDGQTRRIHILVWLKSIETAEKINKTLTQKGANLLSDGRPILGLTSEEIVDIVLSIDPESIIVPAHIWTPWFSMYGSKSGFDSIKECFGKYKDEIWAIETGLSSDPAMNWRVKELDKRVILSNSDAHSGAKLGREMNIFELENLSFTNIRKALRQRRENKSSDAARLNHVSYTIEFYPDEGKYHYTGHRKCNIRQSPEETRKKGTICPVCGKKLTVGVEHRVEELAGRSIKDLNIIKKVFKKDNGVELKGVFAGFDKTRPPYIMLVPLQEILSEVVDAGVKTKKVQNEYNNLIRNFGSEFDVLLETPLSDISSVAGERTKEAIEKVRTGNIVVEPGYDGVFGVVKIWGDKNQDKQNSSAKKQLTMF